MQIRDTNLWRSDLRATEHEARWLFMTIFNAITFQKPTDTTLPYQNHVIISRALSSTQITIRWCYSTELMLCWSWLPAWCSNLLCWVKRNNLRMNNSLGIPETVSSLHWSSPAPTLHVKKANRKGSSKLFLGSRNNSVQTHRTRGYASVTHISLLVLSTISISTKIFWRKTYTGEKCMKEKCMPSWYYRPLYETEGAVHTRWSLP